MNAFFNDPFAEYEAELVAKAKADIEKEDAAWQALPQDQKDRISAERQAILESMFDAVDEDQDEDQDDDQDEDEE